MFFTISPNYFCISFVFVFFSLLSSLWILKHLILIFWFLVLLLLHRCFASWRLSLYLVGSFIPGCTSLLPAHLLFMNRLHAKKKPTNTPSDNLSFFFFFFIFPPSPPCLLTPTLPTELLSVRALTPPPHLSFILPTGQEGSWGHRQPSIATAEADMGPDAPSGTGRLCPLLLTGHALLQFHRHQQWLRYKYVTIVASLSFFFFSFQSSF